MQARKLRLSVAIAAAVIVLRFPMYAQNSTCSQAPFASFMPDSLIVRIPGQHAAPYTGKVRTTFEQKLADGNRIHSTSEVTEARDSAGRTITERPGCAPGADGQMHPVKSVNINDPVARTSMNWTEGDDLLQPKVVRVFHQQQRQTPAQKQELTPEQQEQRERAMQAIQAQAQEQKANTRTEQLGTKTIAGVSADGVRVTRTVPAGAQGNDLPMEMVTETWRSKDLGLTLMSVHDDPRNGRTTAEYVELELAEPDAALFTPPAGYTIEDETPPGMVMGGFIGSVNP